MLLNIPNLLEGKILTGVLPLEKQPPLQYFLPQHNQSELLVDIEACIDDPSLAPLGFHVQKKKKKQQQQQHVLIGQVNIQAKDSTIMLVNNNGIAMLRRRGLESTQLALELDALLLLPPTYLKNTLQIQYKNLVELDISRNRLTHFPHQIEQLAHLRILNAASNQLTEIPKEIYLLTELQVLTLSQNQIKVLPEEMPHRLPNLVTLRIAANDIDTLPTCLDDWKKMRHLQLGSVYGGNRLTQLPDTLADMNVLEELDVSYNQLCRLPNQLEIPTLLTLNVSHNQLDFVPKSIARCQKLKSLNLSKNHLTSLPADLVHLRQLELFDISDNLLCIMPAEILERMQSATLLITGNPLTRPGHCDGRHQDAYSKIIRQMTQRGLTRSSSPVITARDQCGPRGMGCLPSPPISPSTSSSTTTIPTFHLSNHDEDASIDQELSYHAQQLNINGSTRLNNTPILPPLPTETKLLLHSLKEICTRSILKHDNHLPLTWLAPHLAQDILGEKGTCSYCQGPFIHEWVTSVQVKSFGGHPAVVRRVRFCSNKCWIQCLPKEEHSKSVICVHKL